MTLASLRKLTRRELIGIWDDAEKSGDTKLSEKAMKVMAETQDVKMTPRTYPKRKFKMNGR